MNKQFCAFNKDKVMVKNRLFKIFCYLLTGFFLIPSFLKGQNYELVWFENFSGSQLDLSSWTYEVNGNGGGNNELQYYTDRSDNVFLEDGKLIIQAKKENYLNKQYTSARIITQNKKFYKYGRIEARIKLPFGKGMWPAFWMLGGNIDNVGWPKCGEIDIMEMIGGTGNDNRIYGTAHWDNNGSHASYGGSKSLSSGKFADDFHLFAIEWTKNSIRWYLDGNQYHVIDITPAELQEFHQNYFIILNLAVGGNWPGSPDATTSFPQRMEVDYVSVYQDRSEFPNVTLTNPAAGNIIEPFSDIQISADASDPDGSILKVEFFQDDALLGVVEQPPYNILWEGIYPGCYNIKAKATDNSGNYRFSQMLNIKVGEHCIQAPYLGVPISVPGLIEAENYDIGGQGIAYNDSDPLINNGLQSGTQFRQSEGVDIQTSGEGGYNVGWIEDGEWLNYMISVKSSGIYSLIVRAATPNSGSKFRIEIDGQDLTGSVNILSTGGYQNWGTITRPGINLKYGDHVLKIIAEKGGFNLDNLTLRLDFPTSVKETELEMDNEIYVYPNPFNNQTKVIVNYSDSRPFDTKLVIYNGLGQQLHAEPITIYKGSNEFPIAMNYRMNSGIYFISIKFNSVNLVRKVMYLK
ncbi:MAG: hypothetical protein CVV23_11590 [Ignavibacteriae bacterium HGW-Ignavibacteriae-2]|jgi:beta-glucanase (GH16 family)|nr:family 16 glycosylhydrolase [Bacteroidota bacterium]PKL88167.1 MAG: hypothetical protein CVV23_11590 [Ignavibacteriae bacterium HGW-Ignavibacteriae-2]